MSGYTPGLTTWKLLFQLSPIILTNGIVGDFPGAMLPIIALTESINFPLGLLGGGSVGMEKFFANYQPLPGSNIIRQTIGAYPFANSTVAANATIEEPLQVSMLMVCPVQNNFGWYEKLAVIEALAAALKYHNSLGGTYIVATPSKIYTNCILTGMHDASVGLTKQAQNAWQLDFVKPLLTNEEAAQLMNSLFNKIANGSKLTSPIASGLGAATSTPLSLASSGVTPAAIPSVAANTISAPPSAVLGQGPS